MTEIFILNGYQKNVGTFDKKTDVKEFMKQWTFETF